MQTSRRVVKFFIAACLSIACMTIGLAAFAEDSQKTGETKPATELPPVATTFHIAEVTVELEQMEVTDPEQLRPFLRRVTQIKQEALRELTSEKVRGDQLFAIFLSQCAALSDKIQMRMIYGRLSEPRG